MPFEGQAGTQNPHAHAHENHARGVGRASRAFAELFVLSTLLVFCRWEVPSPSLLSIYLEACKEHGVVAQSGLCKRVRTWQRWSAVSHI